MEFEPTSRFADDGEVVLVGYRDADGSVRLDCLEVESTLGHSTDFLSEASFDAHADGFRECANRLTDEGANSPAAAWCSRSTTWSPRELRSGTSASTS